MQRIAEKEDNVMVFLGEGKRKRGPGKGERTEQVNIPDGKLRMPSDA